MTQRTAFPWWLAALVLLCPAAGWLIGQMPDRATRAREPRLLVGTSSSQATRPAHRDRAPAARGPELSRWTTYDLALEESRRNGKPVLLDFNAAWCGPCRMLKRQLFDAGSMGEAVQEAVIPVSIVDRYREDGRNSAHTEELQRRYQIEAFPTLVVFSPRTGRSAKLRGFGGAERTLSWIQKAATEVQ